MLQQMQTILPFMCILACTAPSTPGTARAAFSSLARYAGSGERPSKYDEFSRSNRIVLTPIMVFTPIDANEPAGSQPAAMNSVPIGYPTRVYPTTTS
jgi:hypothetical protein